jgi:SAM-dependent methyltransferase
MDGSYAAGRKRRAELIFRYKVRAGMVARAVKKYLGDGRPVRICDFGSAEGAALLELDSLLTGASITGIELSDALISRAPALPENVRLARGDITDLAGLLDDETCDAVSALAVLEHLEDPGKAVREASRLLRAGGLFLATCPDPSWDAAAARLGLVAGNFHVSPLNREKLITVVRAAGLGVVSCEKFMFMPLAILPYAGLRVSPDLSMRVDAFVRKLRILDWLFVNQFIVANKNEK